MKKIFNIILVSSFILTFASCEMFKIDNYDGPNAGVKGIIKDSATGEPIQTDIQNGTAIRVYELGWNDPPTVTSTWVVKQSGEYENKMIFASRYNIDIVNGNVFPLDIPNVEFKKGDNTFDITATPYIRVKNPSIVRNGNEIVATFSLEAGQSDVKLSAIRLYAHSDIYVGEQVKYDTQSYVDAEGKTVTYTDDKKTFSPAQSIDGTVYTLKLDVSKFRGSFKYTRNYYFRIGVLANLSGVGTIRHNYSPYEVIHMSF